MTHLTTEKQTTARSWCLHVALHDPLSLPPRSIELETGDTSVQDLGAFISESPGLAKVLTGRQLEKC